MARRSGRKGDYLATDDYTGFVTYASKLKRDYWGNLTARPIERNLQEIASPLNDPKPVRLYRGPQYEVTSMADFIDIPHTIGLTNDPTPNTSPAAQANGWGIFDAGIGQMVIGTTFMVR